MMDSPPPAINARVAYRSFGGDTWDAVIRNIRLGGFVDIDLSGPGLKEPYELHGIRWYDDPENPNPGARPKKQHG